MKVNTDDRIYKGRLYYVGDSGIRIIRGKNYNELPTRIAVADIQQISFKGKNTLFKSITGGLAIGVIFGVLIPSKLYDHGIYISDKAFLYCIAGGAGLGLIGGAFSAPGIKIVIPISKDQHRFEENKLRLKEFSVY